MGTRGLMGVVLDGVVKASYNHFDSYPSALGASMLEELRTVSHNELVELVRAVKLVDEGDTHPGTDESFYDALRDNQGKLLQTLKSGFITDDASFATDSLFCEWAYLIDLDNSVFEVYQGFVQRPHSDGRFPAPAPDANSHRSSQFFQVQLLLTVPLTHVRDLRVLVDPLFAEEFSSWFRRGDDEDAPETGSLVWLEARTQLQSYVDALHTLGPAPSAEELEQLKALV